MSCYITIAPDGTITRNFVGDATIQLQSANNDGAGYVAPACNDPPPGSNPVDQLPAYTIHTSESGGPVAAPEFSWEGAPAMLAVAVMVLLMLKARRIRPSGTIRYRDQRLNRPGRAGKLRARTHLSGPEL
jgi:hypothetical protein